MKKLKFGTPEVFQYFEQLPTPVKSIIIKDPTLSVGEIDAFSETSKQYRRFINNDVFWNMMLQLRYPGRDYSFLINPRPKWVLIAFEVMDKIESSRDKTADFLKRIPSVEDIKRMRSGGNISEDFLRKNIWINKDIVRGREVLALHFQNTAQMVVKLKNVTMGSIIFVRDDELISIITYNRKALITVVYEILNNGYWYAEYNPEQPSGNKYRFIRSQICSSCNTTQAKFICSGCNTTKYCSADCQERDWSQKHEFECIEMRRGREQEITEPFHFRENLVEWLQETPRDWRGTKEFGDRNMEDAEYLLLQRSEEFILDQGGELYSMKTTPKYGFTIQAICVREEYQRSGYATQMIQTVERYAKDFVLIQSVMSDKMRELALKLGYTEMETKPTNYIKWV